MYSMKNPNNRSENGFTIDTCVARRCYDNPAYFDMLKLKIQSGHSKTVFTDVSIYEVDKRTDYGFDTLKSKLESSIGNKIKIEKITCEMRQLGSWLREHNEGLHKPDDEILAYAMLTDSVLVTCDKKLEYAARNVGHYVINPDRAIIDLFKIESTLAKLAQSKVLLIRQKMNRTTQTINKAKSLILKPGKKIVWRSFV